MSEARIRELLEWFAESSSVSCLKLLDKKYELGEEAQHTLPALLDELDAKDKELAQLREAIRVAREHAIGIADDWLYGRMQAALKPAEGE